MVIKYPDNVSQKEVSIIAHRSFGRDLVGENAGAFIVRERTPKEKFRNYRIALEKRELPKPEFGRKEIRRMKRMAARMTLGHIPTKMNRYDPYTGTMPSKFKESETPTTQEKESNANTN